MCGNSRWDQWNECKTLQMNHQMGEKKQLKTTGNTVKVTVVEKNSLQYGSENIAEMEQAKRGN